MNIYYIIYYYRLYILYTLMNKLPINIIVMQKYYKRLKLPNKFCNLSVIDYPDKSNFDKMVG